MPQIKEDQLIAEKYNKLVSEIASSLESYDDEQLGVVKAAIFAIAVSRADKTTRMYNAPDGHRYSLFRIKIMLDEANSKRELQNVYETLGLHQQPKK